jgi:RNA-directed DNA polymerase
MNGKPAIQLWLPWTIEGKPSEEETTAERPSEDEGLMERVVERDNLFRALKQVQSNGGSPGIDGMTVEELAPYLKEHWLRMKQVLLDGTYQPQPVKRVEVPKPQGGIRKLGVPTVVDRFIQQAVMQVLQAQWDPTFSESSVGFRPGRNAHQAVKRAQSYLKEGYTWVVDMDLEKFFDRVNHDKVMSEVSKRVRDRRVLTLIHRFLKAGAMEHDALHETVDGVPQGGPLSPLLSNLLLDRLDRELERRGHRFVRYADDSNVYVRSKRAGYRVLGSLSRFLSTRLKLKVNEAKSAVGRPWERTFLGFRFTRRDFRRCISPEAVKRLKERVREITRRTRGRRIERIAQELRRYLLGWKAYVGYAGGPFHLQGMGLVDSEAPSLLFVEAMGAARVQGAAETRGQSGLGVEHGKVGPRSMALKPESCSGNCLAGQPFRWSGSAEAVHQGIISTEPPWYVIRMPGGVGGAGSRGLALSRLGPIIKGGYLSRDGCSS